MFLLLSIIAFADASNVRIFNLHRRHGYSRGLVIDSTTENDVTIPYYISIAPDENIPSIPGDHSAISLVTSNGELVPIPGAAGARRHPARGYVGIAPGSRFSQIFSSVLFLPPSQDQTTHRLVTGLNNPSDFCNQGVYVTVPMETRYSSLTRLEMTIQVAVSVINRGGENINDVVRGVASDTNAFHIDFQQESDYIPDHILEGILRQISAIANVPPIDRGPRNFDRYIPAAFYSEYMQSLPSIRYTIFDGTSANGRPLLSIVMEPQDYLRFDVNGNLALKLEAVEDGDESYRFGLNFLDSVAVSIDYRNSTLAFCDPL